MYRRKISSKRKSNRFLPKFLLAGFIALVLFVLYLQHTGSTPIQLIQQTKSQTTFAAEANQKIQQSHSGQAPLILQTDETWANTPYGSGNGENTLAKNGCALASLAMVLSYWQHRNVPPTEILDWAQNNYYIADAGTAWTIFPAFGTHFGLICQELGNNLSAAQEYLDQGIPVVVSVKAGDFTNDGHIMVLRDWTDAGISVNDPNDDAAKQHYQKIYAPDTIANQAINYWVYTAE